MTQPHLSTRRILSLFWPKWRGMKNVLIRQDFTVALFATLFSLFYCPSSVQLHKALKFQTPATRVSLFSRPKFLENEKNSKISLRTKFLFKTHLLLILPVRAHVFAARHFNTIFIEGFSCLESINSTINSQKTNKFWQEGSNTSDAISSGSDASATFRLFRNAKLHGFAAIKKFSVFQQLSIAIYWIFRIKNPWQPVEN